MMQTDAASVLNETANNIRYLHEQIKVRLLHENMLNLLHKPKLDPHSIEYKS
jgi:hypothetical protein